MSDKTLHSLRDGYGSCMTDWDQKASVRTKPMKTYTYEEGGLPFSPDLVAITSHPEVQARGATAISRILSLKLIDYLGFTESLELDAILHVCRELSIGRVPFDLPLDMKSDADKIIVDEAHHASCASGIKRQFSLQADVTAIGGVRPRAIRRLYRQVQPLVTKQRALAMTAFGIVSETLITGTLTDVPRDQRVHSAVRETIIDHARDEAFHHKVFSALAGIMWEQLEANDQDFVGANFARYIVDFLLPDLAKEAAWLVAVGFDSRDAKRIVCEVHNDVAMMATMKRSARPSMNLFEKIGVLDNAAAQDAFGAAGLLN